MTKSTCIIFVVGVCIGLIAVALAKHPSNAGPEDVEIKFKLPPPEALSAEDELKSFKIAEGFEIQLVAAEPLVEDPVALSFDAQGRMWVVEMRGYMHDIEGRGENERLGRIRVLSDEDGDGRFEKASVFLDGLVMPRGVMVWRDGVIVAEPPNLVFWRDSDGDGKGDEQTIITSNYGSKGGQPEHMANSPTLAMDNWIYSASYGQRFRMVGGKWVSESTRSRGQWGLSQDDVGRLYYNYNSDLLRADLVSGHYFSRNPNFTPTTGVNVKLMAEQTVWPSHPTPGVNRGYQPGGLREDGTLKNATATCGAAIYRGDLFGEEFRGNAFIPEPAANLVKRVIIEENEGMLAGRNAYSNRDFLTSTDERFRPVNCYIGPEGALYIVDLYRGVLQHRAYLTNYLIKNIKERKLEAPINRGRIWRVVPKGAKPVAVKIEREPRLLEHPNGWVRDTVQRRLIEERTNMRQEVLVKAMAKRSESPIGRLHALWTMEGMGRMESATAVAALADRDAKVRSAAVRLCEPYLVPATRAEVLPEILKLVDDPAFDVRLQLALTLSSVPEESAMAAVEKILEHDGDKLLMREAVLSGLRARELEFLERVIGDFNQPTPTAKTLISALAQCVINERRDAKISRLLDLAGEQKNSAAWKRTAILEGMAVTRGRAPVKLIFLDEKPKSLDALLTSDGRLAERVLEKVAWPGKPGVVVPPPPRALTADEQGRFEEGKAIYAATCATCHQPSGLGQDGLAPPLVDSEWVLGPPSRLARILMHGVSGPITVTGVQFRLEMPGLPDLGDNDIAAVLTYIRREWDHGADPVEADFVKRIRTEEDDRNQPWTAAELLKIR
jgi:mono/diheme cytochrome c family protein/glucose/arabinose dehydrogenase